MSDTAVPPRAPFAARLGWRVEHRPRPAFAHVLGAAAGAFLVVAVVAFVVEVSSDDPTAPGVGFNAALVILALILGFRASGPLRAASVTAVVLGVPLVWAFAFFGGGDVGRGEVRGVLLLTLASYAVLYLAGWTRGRAIFLAGVLIFFASWVTFEVAGSGTPLVPFQTRSSSTDVGGFSSPSTGGTFSTGQFSASSNAKTDETSIAALVIGIVFLWLGALLDRKRLAGAATPFIAVGALEAIAGAAVLGGNHSALAGGLLAAAAGVLVGLVGAHGEDRRGSTWIGVLAIFGGLVAVIVDIHPASAGAVGGIALGFSAALGVIAWWLASALGEPDDGGDEGVSPISSPPGGDATAAVDEPVG